MDHAELVHLERQFAAAFSETFIIVSGHAQFYPRFGFRPASVRAVRPEWDVPDDMSMLMVLDEQQMHGVSG